MSLAGGEWLSALWQQVRFQHPGDIIIAVNSQRVFSIKQLRETLLQAGKHAAVLVQREGDMIFIPLRFQDE